MHIFFTAVWKCWLNSDCNISSHHWSFIKRVINTEQNCNSKINRYTSIFRLRWIVNVIKYLLQLQLQYLILKNIKGGPNTIRHFMTFDFTHLTSCKEFLAALNINHHILSLTMFLMSVIWKLVPSADYKLLLIDQSACIIRIPALYRQHSLSGKYNERKWVK